MNGIRSNAPFFFSEKRGLEIANRQLKVLADSLEGVRTLALFNAAGTMIASNRPEILNRNYADRAYFQVPLKEKNPSRLYVSAPIKTVLGVYSVVLSKSLVSADGEFAGIVTATLDPQDFKNTLEGAHDSPDSISAILHGNGQAFLFAPDAAALPASDTAKMGDFFEDHKRSGLVTSVRTGFSPDTNAKRMMAMTTVYPPSLAMDYSLTISFSRDFDLFF
ncbi:MAG TPA: hypothetical protein PLB25_15755, partial [Rhodoferax sp.]|nr:hypothetical protein [Rhodoferax sp.]